MCAELGQGQVALLAADTARESCMGGSANPPIDAFGPGLSQNHIYTVTEAHILFSTCDSAGLGRR